MIIGCWGLCPTHEDHLDTKCCIQGICQDSSISLNLDFAKTEVLTNPCPWLSLRVTRPYAFKEQTGDGNRWICCIVTLVTHRARALSAQKSLPGHATVGFVGTVLHPLLCSGWRRIQKDDDSNHNATVPIFQVLFQALTYSIRWLNARDASPVSCFR